MSGTKRGRAQAERTQEERGGVQEEERVGAQEELCGGVQEEERGSA